MRVIVLVLVLVGENKVYFYSDQLKLGQVCKFGVEFDNKHKLSTFGSERVQTAEFLDSFFFTYLAIHN